MSDFNLATHTVTHNVRRRSEGNWGGTRVIFSLSGNSMRTLTEGDFIEPVPRAVYDSNALVFN